MEKEIKKKENMNLIKQKVLIKLLRAGRNIFHVPNNKFDELLTIIGSFFDHLKARASMD